jgi:hypothetical protein
MILIVTQGLTDTSFEILIIVSRQITFVERDPKRSIVTDKRMKRFGGVM